MTHLFSQCWPSPFLHLLAFSSPSVVGLLVVVMASEPFVYPGKYHYDRLHLIVPYFSPDAGASDLLGLPPRKIKIGIVNINKGLVKDQLSSVLSVPLHAVTLSARHDTSLESVFSSDHNFRAANGTCFFKGAGSI